MIIIWQEQLKEVLKQVKNVGLLFLNVFEALIQSNLTILLYPHWLMKSQKVLCYILVPMILIKEIMIMLIQKILHNELLLLRKNVDRLVLATLQFHPFLWEKTSALTNQLRKLTRRFPVCVQKIFFILYVMTRLMSVWYGKMVSISPTMLPKC